MKISVLGAGISGAVAALLFASLGDTVWAGPLGPGDPCDPPIAEDCANGTDDDEDGWIDCLDPDCVPAETDVVCGPDGVLHPACRALEADGGKMRFKQPLRPDSLTLGARALPSSDFDPASETVRLTHRNAFGDIYSEVFPPGTFVPNKAGLRWKVKRKRDGSTQVYQATLREKLGGNGESELFLTFKIEGDLWFADPLRNTAHTEEELGGMVTQVSIGDDSFFLDADWERCPCGWELP
jgi:hypothetical protein